MTHGEHPGSYESLLRFYDQVETQLADETAAGAIAASGLAAYIKIGRGIRAYAMEGMYLELKRFSGAVHGPRGPKPIHAWRGTTNGLVLGTAIGIEIDASVLNRVRDTVARNVDTKPGYFSEPELLLEIAGTSLSQTLRERLTDIFSRHASPLQERTEAACFMEGAAYILKTWHGALADAAMGGCYDPDQDMTVEIGPPSLLSAAQALTADFWETVVPQDFGLPGEGV